jgi:predicted RNA-binding Zn ribbon-like protein
VRTVALIEASVQPGGRDPAPGGLGLVQAFVNTVDREHGPDLLDTAEDFDAWCAHRGFAATDRGRAREVREALRGLLWAKHRLSPAEAGPALDAEARVARDRQAESAAILAGAAHRLRARFAPPRLEGEDAVDAVLAAAFLAMADGSWERLKACPGRNCGWAFYDRSANGSATWCSMQICGNRSKARAYYARRR